MTRKKDTAPPADLFESYQDALAAADTALVDARGATPQLLAVSVQTDEQASWAADIGHKVAAVRKALETKRDTAKKPWYTAYKTIQSAAKPAIDLLDQVERHLKSEIVKHERAKAIAQAAAMPLATSPEEITAAVACMSAPPAGVQLRESWTWEPIDGGPRPVTLADAASRGLQIPAEYYLLDFARIDREARTRKSALQIPGVRPKLEPTVAFVKE